MQVRDGNDDDLVVLHLIDDRVRKSIELMLPRAGARRLPGVRKFDYAPHPCIEFVQKLGPETRPYGIIPFSGFRKLRLSRGFDPPCHVLWGNRALSRDMASSSGTAFVSPRS